MLRRNIRASDKFVPDITKLSLTFVSQNMQRLGGLSFKIFLGDDSEYLYDRYWSASLLVRTSYNKYRDKENARYAVQLAVAILVGLGFG